jgi:hypothetical protein
MEYSMNRRSSVLTLILIVSSLAMAGCEFKASTANISDAKLARGINEKKEPVEPTTTFTSADRQIYAFATLANAPAGTLVRAIWKSPDGSEKATDVQAGGDMNEINFSLTLTNPLPPGAYKCEIYLDPSSDPAKAKAEKPEKVLDFTVTE